MREQAIKELLMSIFSLEELMRFLRFGPQGKEILASLPMMKASFDDVAYQAVEVLNRRGLIGEQFFRQLKIERPNRIPDIDRIEGLWSTSLRPDVSKTPGEKEFDSPMAMNEGESRKLSPSGNQLNLVKQVTTLPDRTQRSVRSGIFISYSHKDARWLERLQIYLKPLERETLLNRWDDTMIKPGQRWKDEISEALQSAKIAVLLLSADFLASDFITKIELPSLLAAAESEGLTVLPVIVGACGFARTAGLARFQAVNSPGKTLEEMGKPERDRVFLKLVERIEEILNSAEST
jgi:hypothetical protein